MLVKEINSGHYTSGEFSSALLRSHAHTKLPMLIRALEGEQKLICIFQQHLCQL